MTSLISASSVTPKHVVYEIQNTTSQELNYIADTSALSHIFPDGFEESLGPYESNIVDAQVNCTKSTERIHSFSQDGKPCQHLGTNNNGYTMQYKELNDLSVDLRLQVSSSNNTCCIKQLS